MWKSLQFVPVVAKPKAFGKLAAAVPVLVSVTICVLLVLPTATLPKLSDAGDSVKLMLPVPLPVPLSDSLWGLPGALSQMLTVPDLVPAKVGVNLTLSVQEAPGSNVPPQLLPWLKSPERMIPLSFSVPPPVFFSVTNLAALMVPTA